jgi:hypothetical protein
MNNVQHIMHELTNNLNSGKYLESIGTLDDLLLTITEGIPEKAKLDCAVAMHKHTYFVKLHYENKFNETEDERGFAINPSKIISKFMCCARTLNPGDESDVSMVCKAIEAKCMIDEEEFEPALEVLGKTKDAYLNFLSALCWYRLGNGEYAESIVERGKLQDTKFSYVSFDWDDVPKFEEIRKDFKTREKKIKSRRWPRSTEASIDRIIRTDISNWSGGPRSIIGPEDEIVTFGSCFARNVSFAFERARMKSRSFTLVEEVNNTSLNLILFKMIEKFYYNKKECSFLNESINELYRHINKCNVLIFTCGTSIGFFDQDGQPAVPSHEAKVVDAVFFQNNTARKIGVEENVSNLRAIIKIIRLVNPKVKIIMTVSPVPLSRSFEVDSALIGDCVSKSSLRMAVEMVLEDQLNDVFYWPSFEIAKWILPHFGADKSPEYFFGADDNYSRHPSRRMVDLIVESFLDYALIDEN